MAFNHKHLIDITEYSADDIMAILETAVKFKEVNERRIKPVSYTHLTLPTTERV